MTDADTSPEAVERLIGRFVKPWTQPTSLNDQIATTLTALSARVQELEAALATAREDALREAAETAMEEMRDWKREGFHSEAHAAKCASKAILALIPEQDQ